jgi:hypothetical protein
LPKERAVTAGRGGAAAKERAAAAGAWREDGAEGKSSGRRGGARMGRRRRKEQVPLVEEGRLPKKGQQPLVRGERTAQKERAAAVGAGREWGGAEGKSSRCQSLGNERGRWLLCWGVRASDMTSKASSFMLLCKAEFYYP